MIENQTCKESFQVSYPGWKKALTIALSFIVVLFALSLLEADDPFAVIFAVPIMFYTLFLLTDVLLTESVIFTPERIVKRRFFFPDTVLDTSHLLISLDEYFIRFVHGSKKNRRERVTIHKTLISPAERNHMRTLAASAYHVSLVDEDPTDDREKLNGEVSAETRTLADKETAAAFDKAVDSDLGAIFLAILYVIVVAFLALVNDNYNGIWQQMRLQWVRYTFIIVGVSAYFLLKYLADSTAGIANLSAPGHGSAMKLRLDKLVGSSYVKAIVCHGVILVGFLEFLIFANLLDFILFLAVGAFYYFDFYPRLSEWQRVVGFAGAEGTTLQSVSQPFSNPRRSSLQISLVLMGMLAMASYGEEQRYVYKNKQDCMDDWGGGECQPAPHGSAHYGRGYYYGGRSGGTSFGGGVRSIGRATVSRGGFGSMGGFHASFGG